MTKLRVILAVGLVLIAIAAPLLVALLSAALAPDDLTQVRYERPPIMASADGCALIAWEGAGARFVMVSEERFALASSSSYPVASVLTATWLRDAIARLDQNEILTSQQYGWPAPVLYREESLRDGRVSSTSGVRFGPYATDVAFWGAVIGLGYLAGRTRHG